MNTQSSFMSNKNMQRNASHFHRKQGGVMLLEAIISILIFSFGILAIVGLQAAAIKNSGDAKYRTDASLLANQLIGDMWANNRTPAILANNYQSPGGARYQAWLNTVTASGLPGQADTPPIVGIAQINNIVSGGILQTSSLVTVTIRWKAPNELETHQYTTVAQIF